MYSEVLRPGVALGQYPERDHARRNAFDATLHNALGVLRRCSLNHTRRADRFVAGVNARVRRAAAAERRSLPATGG